ncbi:MAG: 1-acyl-sn-glycerol-3-phosphate acyltransferase [Bacteroidetes bacterium]|jgi:putative hemolysin|nr:1-acyl-sn-glycerol-3-phosphate acyltransferase [Bacteroidota bacterium]
MDQQERFIDIEKIIASKNPRLLKWLPGPVLRYIKRILHEADVNKFMALHGNKKGIAFIHAVFREFDVRIESQGVDHIPAQGGCYIIGNHPLGGLDGLALIEGVYNQRRDIQFLVNDILLHLEPLQEFFVPVNKHGTQREGEKIEAAYRSEHAILIFPAGLVSRKQNGEVSDLEWKKSFVNKAVQYHQPIVPAFIEGANSPFFYNLALWRKRLGIKANIEMFYLVDEMYKQKNKTIRIIFDRPVMSTHLDKSKSPREWARLFRDQVYAIRDQRPGPFTKQ